MAEKTGIFFNIQKFSIHDGPGIRTTVFLKGCPLRCQWCHNPESNLVKKQVMYSANLCRGCGTCVRVCPRGCFRLLEGKCRVDFDACLADGACVEACPCGALSMAGERLTAAEVMEQVKKDMLYYKTSGGGVTFSGGEPLMQPDILEELLQRSRAEGIHTAIESCGFAPPEVAKRIFPQADMLLLDIKHMDPEEHRRLTGQSNQRILENFLFAARETEAAIWVRMPLLSGINDGEENLERLIEFLEPVKARIEAVWFLPFHRLGISKLESMGLSTQVQEGFSPPASERLETMSLRLTEQGYSVHIS